MSVCSVNVSVCVCRVSMRGVRTGSVWKFDCPCSEKKLSGVQKGTSDSIDDQ